MKNLAFAAVAAALLPAASFAQAGIESYAALPETWDAAISPDGTHLALGCSPTGIRGLCVFKLGSSDAPSLILPSKDARIQRLRWASDEYLLYYLNTTEDVSTVDGARVISFNRLASYNIKTGESEILLRGFPGSSTNHIASMLLDKPDKILMDMTFMVDSTPEIGSKLTVQGGLEYRAYEVNLKNGKGQLKSVGTRTIRDRVYDETGEPIADIQQNLAGKDFSIISLVDGKKTIFERGDTELWPLTIQAVTPDHSQLIVDFDDGAREGLYTMSLSDGAIAPFTHDGQPVGDVNVVLDDYTKELIGFEFTDDLDREVYTSEPFASVARNTAKPLGADTVLITSTSRDRQKMTLLARSAGKPDRYFYYDAAGPALSPIGGEAPWLDNAVLGTVLPITYAARDGLEIHAYMTLPPGKTRKDGPFPLVVMPHGGPESRDTAGYDWMAQAVAAQGYLVLQPNFRGSAGYGAAFRDAGFGEFGGKMITDIIDGAAWAVSEGLASPNGYCSMGASYGGYAALMTALKDGEHARCVVSINGVSDPVSQTGSIYKYDESTRYWERYLGDIRIGDAQTAISPARRASEISAPVLLLHGRDDTTVLFDQSERMARGLPPSQVRLVPMAGDDHYLSSTESRKLLLTEALDFLSRNHPARPE